MKTKSVANGGLTTKQIDMLTRDLLTGMRAIHSQGIAFQMTIKRLRALGLQDDEIDKSLCHVYGTAWKLASEE